MKIKLDKESGAFYITIRDGEYSETLDLVDPGFGAYVDIDDEGNVLGLEFLSFEEFAEITAEGLEIPEIADQEPGGSEVPKFTERETGGLVIPYHIEDVEAFIESRKQEPAMYRWEGAPRGCTDDAGR